MKQLKEYIVPPLKEPGYPTCWRCNEYSTYGYEMKIELNTWGQSVQNV